MTGSGLRVALRADASAELGSGHVMRCLTLADALRLRGAETVLISRGLPESLRARAAEAGCTVVDLPTEPSLPGTAITGTSEDADAAVSLAALTAAGGADRLIVDHYGLGATYERTMRSAVPWIAAIDDLADRSHDCDLLLDQNLAPGGAARYTGLVPDSCRLLLGPRYALLREEFAEAALRTRRRDGAVRELLVFTGGGDDAGMTLRALEAVTLLGIDVRVTCVVGAGNPNIAAIAAACGDLRKTRLVIDTPDMAVLMSRADVALGAAGTATWERCFLGLPTLLMSFAQNQVPVAAGVASAGAAADLGWLPAAEAVAESLRALIDDPARTLAMGDAARELVRGARPGHGSEFSIRGMAGPTPCLLRPFAPDDEATVLEWRNSARVRTRSITDRAITPAEHHVWFGRALDVLASLHWVFEVHGRPEGVVSLEAVSGDVASRAWSFYLGRDSTEPGLGTAMCRLALREAFQVEGIAHVTAEVLADNGPSLRLHERLGFQRAGMRERGRCAGPADTVLLNLARDAWRAMEETWQGTDPCGLPAIRR